MHWKNYYNKGLDSFAKRDFDKALFYFQNAVKSSGGGVMCSQGNGEHIV